jgi:hypothetical protein
MQTLVIGPKSGATVALGGGEMQGVGCFQTVAGTKFSGTSVNVGVDFQRT